VKAETVRDFVALAKADPGKITIASGGIGSATHLTAELFQAKTDIKLVHVPRRGTSKPFSRRTSSRRASSRWASRYPMLHPRNSEP
jgi:tripartite-type tricarboxylate transporter receptor subunit TctC